MKTSNLDDDFTPRRWAKEFQKIAIRKGEKIENSNVFMSLFTTDYKNDPQIALELGIALILNKPIVLTVPHGVEVPSHLEKIAFAIEYFDKGDMASFEAASKKIIVKINDMIKNKVSDYCLVKMGE